MARRAARGLTRCADAAYLRSAFGAVPCGVTAVGAVVDGRPVGLAVSSFTSVSLDPPLVSFCVARTSSTWPTLRHASRIGVSVLAAHQQHAGRQLGGPRDRRFVDLAWREVDGAIALEGSSAWFGGTIEQEVPAGDHDIVVLRLRAIEVDHCVTPLVFHGSRFRELAR